MVGDGEFGHHVGHVVLSAHGHCLLVGSERGELHGGVAPHLVVLVNSGAHVVVGDGTPEVGFQGSALAEHLVAKELVAGNKARLAAELHFDVAAADADVGAVLLVGEFQFAAFLVGQIQLNALASGYYKLLLSQLLSAVDEPFGAFLQVAHVEQHLAGTLNAVELVGKAELHALLGLAVENIHIALLCHAAIYEQLPLHAAVVERAEEVLVIHADDACAQIHGLGPDVLILVGNLVGMRIELAVGTHNAVAVEVVVAGVVAVVVTAVGVGGNSGRRLHVASVPLARMAVERLVGKVPVESALEFRVLANQVPVGFQPASRVAHGVVVFALDERLLLGSVGGIALTPLGRGIHGAHDVGVLSAMSLLPLHGAALVHTLYPLVSGCKVGTVGRLIAHRPHNDAGVIELYLHIVLVAL